LFLEAPFVHLQTYWIGSNVVFSLVVFIMFKIMFCSTQQNFSNSWKIHPGVHQSCQRGRRANWKCPTWTTVFVRCSWNNLESVLLLASSVFCLVSVWLLASSVWILAFIVFWLFDVWTKSSYPVVHKHLKLISSGVLFRFQRLRLKTV
jgi:hypothetical protein